MATWVELATTSELQRAYYANRSFAATVEPRYSGTMTRWLPVGFVALLLLCTTRGPLSADVTPATSMDRVPGPSVQILEHRQKSEHPTSGPPNAPVTLELFVNLDDSRSKPMLQAIDVLAARHPKRLHIIYRLTSRHPPTHTLAHHIAIASWKQGQFFEFLDVFTRAYPHRIASKEYVAIAKQLGIPLQHNEDRIDTDQHTQQLNANHFYWRRMNGQHLPGMLVNGRPTPITAKIEKLESIYDQAYQESTTLLRRGVPKAALHQRLRRQYQIDRPEYFRGHRSSQASSSSSTKPSGPVPIFMGPFLQSRHRNGPHTAPIKAVFFCHLQTSLCRALYLHLRDLRRIYPTELQLIYMPLFYTEQVGQNQASAMYEAALCADEQGAFWSFTDALSSQRVRSEFTLQSIAEFATALDLDTARFEQCLDTGRQLGAVEKNLATAMKSHVQHTPAVAINGRLYSRTSDFNALQTIIEDLLAPGLLETLSQP